MREFMQESNSRKKVQVVHSDDELIQLYTRENSQYGDAVDKVASRALDKMVRTDPERAWAIITVISGKEMTDACQSIFAAGPLEDLLVEHGHSLIERVVDHARVNPKFKDQLGGVWTSRMDAKVASAIEGIRDKTW